MNIWKKRMACFLACLLILGLFTIPEPANAFADSCVLHAKRSGQFQQFEMDIYDSVHGPLYLMTLDGELAFCMDYGKHSPSGSIYEKMDLGEKIPDDQREVIRQGLMFSLYLENCIYGDKEWGAPGLENMTADSGQYLLMQIWVWAAVKGLSSLECADCVRRTYISWGSENQTWADNTYQMAEDFLEAGMDQSYTVEIAAYSSGNAANQDMFTYDFSTFQPVPGELAVGVYKVGVQSGKSYAGAVYGVYSDSGCSSRVAEVTTGADGKGSAVFSGKEGTYYLKEKTAPKGTVLNSTVYPVSLTYGSLEQIPYITAANAEWSGRVSVTKCSEENTPLSGAAFDLEEWDGGKYVFHSRLEEQSGGIYSTGEIFYRPANQGKYRIVEVAAPAGHVNSGWKQELTLTKDGQTFAYTVTNAPWRASVQVVKTDAESGNQIKGAVFSVEEWNGHAYVPAGTLLDQGNGVYRAENLAYTPLNQGKFRIREEKAPDGYVNSGWTQEFVLTRDGQSFSYSLENMPVKGSILLMKVDEETGGTPQGDATLEGAVYGLYARADIPRPDRAGLLYQAGELVKTGTIEHGGTEFTDLYPGSYFVKEIESPEGYQYSSAEYEVELSSEDQTKPLILRELTVKEAVKKSRVRLLKISSDGTAGEVSPLAGAEFTFKLKREADAEGWEKARTFDIAATNSEGTAVTKELPYGVYLVRETKVPPEHAPVRDFLVEVREHRPSEPISIILNDTPFQAYIKIIKTDQDTGEVVPLDGAAFQIRDQDGALVKQKVGDRFIDTFVTDETGTVTTPLMNVSGTYTVTEIKAPPGYRINDTEVEFAVSHSEAELDEAGDPIISVQVSDPALKVDILKTDLITQGPVSGARLQVLDAQGKVIDEWVTEEEPHRIHGIPAGDYILREIEAPKGQGYVRAEDLNFRVEEAEEAQEINLQEDSTKVEVDKLDQETGNYLTGAEMQILDHSGNILYEWTSGDGPKRFDRLPVGTYILREISAPAGYVKADDLPFTVEETGDVQKLELGNDFTKVEVSKLDRLTGKYLPGAVLQLVDSQGEVVREWESGESPEQFTRLPAGTYLLVEVFAPAGYLRAADLAFSVRDTGELQQVELPNDYTKLEISKIQEADGSFLPGASLQLLEENGQVLYEWVSGDRPAILEFLEPGNYVLHESKAPDGYSLAEDISFTLEETGEWQKVVMKNRARGTITGNYENGKESRNVKTGDSVSLAPWIGLAALAGMFLGTVWRIKRRRKHEGK